MSIPSVAAKGSEAAALALLGDKIAIIQFLVYLIFLLLAFVCGILIWSFKREAERHKEQTQELITGYKKEMINKVDIHRDKMKDALLNFDKECKANVKVLGDVASKQETHKERIDKIEAQQASQKELIQKDFENVELKLQSLNDDVKSVTEELKEVSKSISQSSKIIVRIAEHLHIDINS